MKPDKETQDKWLHDPNNWKWDFFYYNKEDKRIFHPKKIPPWALQSILLTKNLYCFFYYG